MKISIQSALKDTCAGAEVSIDEVGTIKVCYGNDDSLAAISQLNRSDEHDSIERKAREAQGLIAAC
jgi:hypothetical protein